MEKVRPKKHLGQHFLKDAIIAREIVDSLEPEGMPVLEIGPGMGVLTEILLKKEHDLFVVDIDIESVEFLKRRFPALEKKIIYGDFLRLPLDTLFDRPFAVIGNFPYNISSQILFKVIENKDKAVQVVGMFQKEVAERIASGPGSRDYGILSVLMQAFYDVEYLFSVPEHVFEPPPKVKSGVIRCRRNTGKQLNCDEVFYRKVVKAAFNQRRKTLRNALKALLPEGREVPFLGQRAEELSWEEFAQLTRALS
jgi:16S rRNA (adenine1518-N6/adenine1519-N6)-dimethyltransferase